MDNKILAKEVDNYLQSKGWSVPIQIVEEIVKMIENRFRNSHNSDKVNK